MSTPQLQPASQPTTVASAGTATPPLIPPHTIRIKRARDEAPVPALYVPTSSTKRIKTSDVDDSTLNPSYVFRLAHTLPPGVTFQPKPSDDEIPLPEPPSATPPPSRKRKIAPVRKYQLSKRARTRHPHPYSPRAGAVFELVKDEDMRDSSPEPIERPTETNKERKKPQTHPKEKAALQAAREKGGDRLTLGYEDDVKLMKEMEKLVLEYLDDDTNDAIRNLPPTTTAADRIGGGVGGGTWAEKDKDVAMAEEDEDGFVYDVYFREEVPAGKKHGEGEEAYGVIVFAESEDEAWWYEGADEEEDHSDVYASDDEDSNAEDYHTNDYPDEPVLAEDEEDEYGHGIHDYSDDDDDDDDEDDVDSDAEGIWRPWKPRRTVPGEEEYDLEDESEDEEPAMRRMVKEVWSSN